METSRFLHYGTSSAPQTSSAIKLPQLSNFLSHQTSTPSASAQCLSTQAEQSSPALQLRSTPLSIVTVAPHKEFPKKHIVIIATTATCFFSRVDCSLPETRMSIPKSVPVMCSW
eukprot:3402355-Pleurochrysis_carterae.AAC.1